MTSSVAKITFVVAEITFKVSLITFSVEKVSLFGCDDVFSGQGHFFSDFRSGWDNF